MLQQFLKLYRPDMDPATNFSVTLLDGGNNDQDQPSVSEGVRATLTRVPPSR